MEEPSFLEEGCPRASPLPSHILSLPGIAAAGGQGKGPERGVYLSEVDLFHHPSLMV